MIENLFMQCANEQDGHTLESVRISFRKQQQQLSDMAVFTIIRSSNITVFACVEAEIWSFSAYLNLAIWPLFT